MTMENLIKSPHIRSSIESLLDNTSLQFIVDGISYEVVKIDGRIELNKREPERAFVIFKGTSAGCQRC